VNIGFVARCERNGAHRTSLFFRAVRIDCERAQLRAAPLDNTRRASRVQKHSEMADEEVSQEVLDGVEGVDEVRARRGVRSKPFEDSCSTEAVSRARARARRVECFA